MPPRISAPDSDLNYRKHGTFHLAIQDPDLEGLLERIVAAGGKQQIPVQHNYPEYKAHSLVCVEDPFGWPVNYIGMFFFHFGRRNSWKYYARLWRRGPVEWRRLDLLDFTFLSVNFIARITGGNCVQEYDLLANAATRELRVPGMLTIARVAIDARATGLLLNRRRRGAQIPPDSVRKIIELTYRDNNFVSRYRNTCTHMLQRRVVHAR